MARIVQMDAIRRQWTSRLPVQLEGDLEQIDKGDPGLSGDILNGVRVEPQVLVVSGAIGKVGVPQIFMRDRRKQDHSCRVVPVVFVFLRLLHEGAKVLLELLQAGRASKR